MKPEDIAEIPLLLCAFVICAVIGTMFIRRRRGRLPPGPYSLPIFGSVSFFREFKHKRHHLLTELVAKYGNIFSIKAGNQLVVFLNGHDLIREAFVKQGDVFSNRPNWLTSLQQGLADGKGLVWQDGSRAALVRKFAHQTLRDFGVGKTSLEQKILREVEELIQILRESQGEPVALKPLMKKSITNIIHDIVFGERFDYDDEKLEEVVYLLEEFFKGGLFIPKNFLPKLICKLLPEDERVYREKQVVVNRLRQYIYTYISEHKEIFHEDNIKDFIDLYIKATKEQTGNVGGLSQGDIFRTILDLFLAGSETTGSTLEWCFLFMVKYPEVQEKCFQEIRKVVSERGPKRTCFADRKHLPYVEATLLEVQRVAPVVPLGLPHVNRKETEIAGFTIPERTIVFGNLYSCLMDPAVWKNPTEFVPERHLDDRGNVTRKEAHIPFSVGSRMCLGDQMAKMEMLVVFTNLLLQFEFLRGDHSDLSSNSIKKDRPINSSHNFDVVVRERVSCVKDKEQF